MAGQAFKNVEIFNGATRIATATVSADETTATVDIDTTKLPDGVVALTAHAWNSPAGTAYTSDADAGPLSLVVNNTVAAAPAPAPAPAPAAPTDTPVSVKWSTAAGTTVSGTKALQLSGQAFKNV